MKWYAQGRGRRQDAPWGRRYLSREGWEGRRPEFGRRGTGAPRHFSMLDTDRDGKVQKAEIQRIRDMLSKVIDEVGDQEVSQEQLRKIFRKLHRGDSPKQKSADSETGDNK